MNARTFKRAGLRFGLAVTAALALCAFASVGTAAATQHWASSWQVPSRSEMPSGSSQEFSGEATGGFSISWVHSGVLITMQCESMSTAGTAENPAGGGAATLEAESVQLGLCTQNYEYYECAIEGRSVPFSPMSGEAVEESGEDLIDYEGAYGELNFVKTKYGESCSLEGSYPIEGVIHATALSEYPGEYTFESVEHRNRWGAGYPRRPLRPFDALRRRTGAVVGSFTGNAPVVSGRHRMEHARHGRIERLLDQ